MSQVLVHNGTKKTPFKVFQLLKTVYTNRRRCRNDDVASEQHCNVLTHNDHYRVTLVDRV